MTAPRIQIKLQRNDGGPYPQQFLRDHRRGPPQTPCLPPPPLLWRSFWPPPWSYRGPISHSRGAWCRPFVETSPWPERGRWTEETGTGEEASGKTKAMLLHFSPYYRLHPERNKVVWSEVNRPSPKRFWPLWLSIPAAVPLVFILLALFNINRFTEHADKWIQNKAMTIIFNKIINSRRHRNKKL